MTHSHRSFFRSQSLGSILLTASLLASCAPTQTGTGTTGLLDGLISDGVSETIQPSTGSADFKATESYTSVIIDARGLGLQASMSPIIYADSGRELYPGGIPVDPDFAVNEGIAAYVYGSLEQAKLSSRAGDNPLVIKAVSADGRSSVNISAQDAEHLSQADGKSLLLSHFKVIFLLDA